MKVIIRPENVSVRIKLSGVFVRACFAVSDLAQKIRDEMNRKPYYSEPGVRPFFPAGQMGENNAAPWIGPEKN